MRRTKRKDGQAGKGNSRRHGFYSSHFTEAELILVAAFTQDLELDDEIWMQRVLNRRLLAFTHSDDESVPLETLVKVAEALAAGTGRVARLLRDKRALSGAAADGLNGALAKALDELTTEFGIQL